jgi:ABC-type transport system involved in cytochrome bd biosynthesis fused ATPase/permease subunit
VIGRLRASPEWRFLGVLPRASPGRTLAWWSLIAIRGALPAAFTIAVGGLVSTVQQGRPLFVPLALVGGVFIAMNALVPVHEALAADLGAKAGAWLHDRLLRACVEPSGLAHLEDPRLADDLAKARTFDLGVAGPPLAAAIPQIGSGFAEIAAGVTQAAILAWYAWWAPLLLAGAWASTHLLLRDSSVWEVFGSEHVVQEQRHAHYAFRLAVEPPAAKEIRLFGLADWTVERVARLRRGVVDLILREQRLRRGPLSLGLALVFAANGVVFWFLARDAVAGTVSLGALVIFAQAAIGTSSLAFGDFVWWFRGSAQPIPSVLELTGSMRRAGALTSGSRQADGLPRREILFRNVRFGYGRGSPPVLDGFDLVIPAGTSLAIVGPNGAGKTTLVKLLCRLYDPLDGSVLVDGMDLRELDLESWRSRIAAVFQDFIRYELSLSQNVAPGGGSEEQVKRALETASAGGLAEPATILSRAYEGGTDLSGGQWQRVALARALSAVEAGAGVVVLDEPTAQLDVRGEAEIFDRILESTRGCTTILISHRFSTVRHADRICVLEGGRVVELGSHEELIAFGGRYRTMFDLQASRFGNGDRGEQPDQELDPETMDGYVTR